MIPDWISPAVTFAAALAATSLVVRALPPFRPYLPEALAIACVAALATSGLFPTDPALGAMWATALWQPGAAALVLLAVWAQRMRPWTRDPTCPEAVLAGLLLGWLPATALLGAFARDARHAARIAVCATGAALASPIGGPAQVLLADGHLAWSARAAAPGVLLVLVAWPWRERHAWPRLPWRLAAPGALGIGGAWWLGGLGGLALATAAALALSLGARRDAPPLEPAPPALDDNRLVRLAFAAWMVTATAQVVGVTWAAAWLSSNGVTFDAPPRLIAGVAVGMAVVLDPFTTAALLARIADQPSAATGLALQVALPAAIVPIPALAIVAWSHGWRVWRHGAAAILLALALAVLWPG